MFNAKAHEAEIIAYNERWERIGEALIALSDMLDMQTSRYAREMFFAARRCPTMQEKAANFLMRSRTTFYAG